MVESVNLWTCDICGETAKTNLNCVPKNWRRAKISAETKYDRDSMTTVFGREEVFDICPSCGKEVSDILTKENRHRKLDITVNGETVKEILK